jgi:hypothetical protein
MANKKSIRITVSGEIRTLTRDEVEQAADEIKEPAPVRKYVVNAGRARRPFPPKQLVARSLKRTPDYFNAHQATKWLRDLDYDVKEIKGAKY